MYILYSLCIKEVNYYTNSVLYEVVAEKVDAKRARYLVTKRQRNGQVTTVISENSEFHVRWQILTYFTNSLI